MKAGVMLLATAVLGLVGCQEPNGPGNFNPAGTGLRVSQALGAIENNQAVQSMAVLSDAFTFAAAAPAAPFPGHALQPAPARPGAFQRLATTLVASSPQALFPAEAMGKTFVYNSEAGQYEASDLAGAPANGARFTLYGVNSAEGTVTLPLDPVGFLDLADQSSAAANTLGITAFLNGVTVLDYDADASVGGGSFSFTAKGFVSEGTHRLDFDLSQSVSGSSGALIDYRITVPGQSPLLIQVNATATSLSLADIRLGITEGDDEMEIAVTTNSQGASGTVKYNGRTLAGITVTGASDPVFTGSGGWVLTPEDLAGLRTLFDIVDVLFERFDDLLFPCYFVFGI